MPRTDALGAIMACDASLDPVVVGIDADFGAVCPS